MAQLFNSKVSIITKLEIRYEGTIYQINPQQQTIALKDVRSFGTEGRRPDHEIPPNSESYDVIVFKAQEIKELKTQEEQTPKIDEIKVEKKDTQQLVQQQQSQQQSQQKQYPQQSSEQQKYTPYQQKHNNSSRAFDFEEMLMRANELEKIKKQDVEPKYNNKNSFFDNLSTSTQKQDRSANPQSRNQNQIDTDTFGNFYKQKTYQKKPANNYSRREQGQRGQGQRVIYVEKSQQNNQQQQ